jgi:hypothetical protein
LDVFSLAAIAKTPLKHDGTNLYRREGRDKLCLSAVAILGGGALAGRSDFT